MGVLGLVSSFLENAGSDFSVRSGLPLLRDSRQEVMRYEATASVRSDIARGSGPHADKGDYNRVLYETQRGNQLYVPFRTLLAVLEDISGVGG